MGLFINIVLLTMLAVVTVAIIRQRSLLGVVILGAIYSFLMASVMMVLHAVDVAMTEASVGAGISTVLLLAVLHLVKTREYVPKKHNVGPLILSVAVGAGLIWGAMDLPAFGDAAAPIHQHVAPRYITQSMTETGVPNLVTAVLADYRSFDTLGETAVVFIAGIGVMLLLRRKQQSPSGPEAAQDILRGDVILQVATKLIFPFILLFALYVQLHGDYGPGGGFQAGVIAAAGVILVAIVFGQRVAKRIAPQGVVERMVPLGVLIFAGTGLVSLFAGRNFLDYVVFAADPVYARQVGILMVEAGVLVTVSGTMIALFYAFVDRGR